MVLGDFLGGVVVGSRARGGGREVVAKGVFVLGLVGRDFVF